MLFDFAIYFSLPDVRIVLNCIFVLCWFNLSTGEKKMFWEVEAAGPIQWNICSHKKSKKNAAATNAHFSFSLSSLARVLPMFLHLMVVRCRQLFRILFLSHEIVLVWICIYQRKYIPGRMNLLKEQKLKAEFIDVSKIIIKETLRQAFNIKLCMLTPTSIISIFNLFVCIAFIMGLKKAILLFVLVSSFIYMYAYIIW